MMLVGVQGLMKKQIILLLIVIVGVTSDLKRKSKEYVNQVGQALRCCCL